MSDDDRDKRIRELEHDVARLRRLLDARGVPGALRHQVRNALGMMRAILRGSVGSSLSIEDYAAHVEGRFDALLRVQALVLASPDETVDLHMMIANELLAMVIHEGERATLDGPPVRLPRRAAELLGLALHELATNAIKFGAMTVPSGRIAIRWAQQDDPARLVIGWTETGLVNVAPSPVLRGFGLETIESMLPYQLGARSSLTFGSDGLRCEIDLPLAR